jgi:hypothetical protein
LSRVTLVNKKHRFNIFFLKKVKATVFWKKSQIGFDRAVC